MIPPEPPTLFALPCGVDFPAQLVAGLKTQLAGQPPQAMARVTLIVNTARMKRRLVQLLTDAGPGFLPRILLVGDVAHLPGTAHLPPPASGLRRRLELVQLVTGLLERQPDLAARSSAFDLADSLAALMDEMQEQDVLPDAIRDLDVSDLSGHWARAQAFFAIAEQFVGNEADAPSPAGHMRQAVLALKAHWRDAPPRGPIILAGSTASRGTTLELVRAVAALPKGMVVLPGFDFDQPVAVWDQMAREPNEDHPQYRFTRLMQTLGVAPQDIRPWTQAAPAAPARNRLISLALRPAPVTDAWMTEGPKLADLNAATQGLTLLEAPSPREEARAIALRLRQAVEDGQRAALISPDRMLTRQVTAALQRWNILPDDSAGLPLHLSAPGRFLRLVAALDTRRVDSADMLTLLKHPLCHSGDARGQHLILTRDLELHLRREGIPFPDADALRHWAVARKEKLAPNWAEWLATTLFQPAQRDERPLLERIVALRNRAEQLAAGSAAQGSGGLWQKRAGEKALAVVEELEAESSAGGDMTSGDFADLLGALLSHGEVRDRDAPHPDVMIWGTLEARVGGADLVILGGLNEGSWPEPAAPDPWLNRPMRARAGLLLPERRIGLSAHDFQQAAAGAEVWLTRATKSDDAETVASRWVNRMTNLLGGLPDTGGRTALDAMKGRGQMWLRRVALMEHAPETPSAQRPAPAPPPEARPRRLSITRVKTLIRDPYAIYAAQVLRLRPLNPLVRAPDALMRGILVHAVLEQVIKDGIADGAALDPAHLMTVAERELNRLVPWPSTRALWSARMARIAQGFITQEHARQALARPAFFETRMQSEIAGLGFVLHGVADRVDLQPDGQVRIYDYKTGTPPTRPVQESFDKQLLIEAAITERGGLLDDPTPRGVADAAFLGVGSKLATVAAPLDSHPPGQVWEELAELISAYLRPEQGFSARRMMQKDTDRSDYDHLSRFGEWDGTDMPVIEVLT